MVAAQSHRDDARSGRQLRRSRSRHLRTHSSQCACRYSGDRRGRHSRSRRSDCCGAYRRKRVARRVGAARWPHRPAARSVDVGEQNKFHANRRKRCGGKQRPGFIVLSRAAGDTLLQNGTQPVRGQRRRIARRGAAGGLREVGHAVQSAGVCGFEFGHGAPSRPFARHARSSALKPDATLSTTHFERTIAAR